MIQLASPPPEEFLDEETRCDHLVSKKTKEIWAVEIDLAQKLLEVCKKNNLKIYADYGTALGAVRHKGFIPWDDDMDFAMFRDDYEKLRKVASKEFKHPYYFEAGDDGEGFLVSGYAKLRNSNTTAIPKIDTKRNMKSCQGIFIDIYPIDNVPNNRLIFAIQKKMLRASAIAACGFAFFSTKYFEPSNAIIRCSTKILYRLFKRPSKVLMKKSLALYIEIAKAFNKRKTTLLESLSVSSIFKPRSRDCFDKIIEVPFEYIKLPISQNYDKSLKILYGNYMTFVKNASEHEGTFFDPNHPYTDYIK